MQNDYNHGGDVHIQDGKPIVGGVPSDSIFEKGLPMEPNIDASKKKDPIHFKLEGEAKDYDWKNIDDEQERLYLFPCGNIVTIDNPLYLYVSKSGHRIFDSDGVSHYIPYGWIHLAWKAKKGEANFRF